MVSVEILQLAFLHKLEHKVEFFLSFKVVEGVGGIAVKSKLEVVLSVLHVFVFIIIILPKSLLVYILVDAK